MTKLLAGIAEEISANCKNMSLFPTGDSLLSQTVAEMLVLSTKGGNIKLC